MTGTVIEAYGREDVVVDGAAESDGERSSCDGDGLPARIGIFCEGRHGLVAEHGDRRRGELGKIDCGIDGIRA